MKKVALLLVAFAPVASIAMACGSLDEAQLPRDLRGEFSAWGCIQDMTATDGKIETVSCTATDRSNKPPVIYEFDRQGRVRRIRNPDSYGVEVIDFVYTKDKPYPAEENVVRKDASISRTIYIRDARGLLQSEQAMFNGKPLYTNTYSWSRSLFGGRVVMTWRTEEGVSTTVFEHGWLTSGMYGEPLISLSPNPRDRRVSYAPTSVTCKYDGKQKNGWRQITSQKTQSGKTWINQQLRYDAQGRITTIWDGYHDIRGRPLESTKTYVYKAADPSGYWTERVSCEDGYKQPHCKTDTRAITYW